MLIIEVIIYDLYIYEMMKKYWEILELSFGLNFIEFCNWFKFNLLGYSVVVKLGLIK